MNSLVYDTHSQLWYEWSTGLSSNTHFPLVSWSIRTPETPVVAEGIFSTGDLFNIQDNYVPVDTTAAEGYFAEDYESEDYDETIATTTANISMEILLANIEMESTDRKFMHSVEYVGSRPNNSQTLTVAWDDTDNSFNFPYSDTIDLQERTKINRLGSFNRRRFKISFSGDEQIRFEGLDATYTQGSS